MVLFARLISNLNTPANIPETTIVNDEISRWEILWVVIVVGKKENDELISYGTDVVFCFVSFG